MPEPAFDAESSAPPPLAVTGSVGKDDSPTPGGQLPSRSFDDLTSDKYDAIAKADTELLTKKIGAEGGMAAAEQRRDDQYRSRMDRMISAEGATIDDIKPWNAAKEMEARKTDLWEQFGSPGFVISMLASAFTAMPMNSALNAGAAAMNAINQGDMKAYDKAFDAWKENSSLTLKRLELEEKQFNQIDTLRSRDMESWRAQATALASRFNDSRMRILLENGYDQMALDAMDQRAKSRSELSDATQRIQENEIRRKLFIALNGDNKDPKKLAQAAMDAETIMTAPKSAEQIATNNVISQPGFRDLPSSEQNKQIQDAIRGISSARYGGRASPIMSEIQRQMDAHDAEHTDESQDERDTAHRKIISDISSAQKPATNAPTMAKEQAQLVEEYVKQGMPRDEAIKKAKEAGAPPVTGNKRVDMESHIGQYDDALKIIDGVDKVLNKYAGAAGVAGRATRLAERVGNILGSNSTDRTQMMRDISQLQLMGPRLLLDQKTGRPLSAEAGHISDIIAGLNIGDTTGNTLRAMKELKERLKTIRDRDKAQLGGPAVKEMPATTDDKPWENDPIQK